MVIYRFVKYFFLASGFGRSGHLGLVSRTMIFFFFFGGGGLLKLNLFLGFEDHLLQYQPFTIDFFSLLDEILLLLIWSTSVIARNFDAVHIIQWLLEQI